MTKKILKKSDKTSPQEKPATITSPQHIRRAAEHLKKKDATLAAILDHPMPWRIRSEHEPYIVLFEAIVHQQLSTKAAGTILGRVKTIYRHGNIPAPAEVLKTPDETLRGAGLSNSKTKAVKDLANITLQGIVPTTQQILAMGDEEIVERLTSIFGIGRWTVEMLLIFNLGRADVLPVGDFAIRNIVREIFNFKKMPTPAQVEKLGESWRPHRTVASLYLWNAIKPKAAKIPVKKKIAKPKSQK